MSKKSGNVQKLDIGTPATIFGRLGGRFRRVRHKTETWILEGWGIRARREHSETTAEASDEERHDRS